MQVSAPFCPCVYEVPFGAFALSSYLLAFALMTALASSRLAFPAKRNGGGLIVRAAGTEARFLRNGKRRRLTG